MLLEALRGLDARAVIVGFGDYRDELEALAPPGTLFTGALEHRHLVHLLPLCDVAVVPSIFPEAFGMVAAEAAAAGVPPVVARPLGPRRGRRRASRPSTRPSARDLVSFPTGDAAALRGAAAGAARAARERAARARPRGARAPSSELELARASPSGCSSRSTD